MDWLARGSSALEWLGRGGFVAYPIGILSVLALGVFLERLWVLRRKVIFPEDKLKNIESLIINGQIPEARSRCQQISSPMARILVAGMNNYGAARTIVKEAMEERGKIEALELKKFLGLLQTIASVSPLLGLLGTVSGMIKVFDAISLDGVGNPASFSLGVSEALISTAEGLCVAIPVFLGQRYLLGRSERFVHALEEYAGYALNLLARGADVEKGP